MDIFSNLFRLPTITYGITACNEVNELKTLLDILVPLIDERDEIIVLQDINPENMQVSALINQYPSIKCIQSRLNGDFASFKNNLIAHATKTYIFQIDADEYPQKTLIQKLKWFLFTNSRADCILLPRINIVRGITEEDIKNWKWEKNDDGYLNFPDFQFRIFKNNGKIRWKNKLHEVLDNYSQLKHLPTKNYEYCLFHIKNIERQRSQSTFYDSI
ncbi:glycosyltransferase [Sphingobacterium olei]|uniref:Glycosyltransferase n=1 Tax=Sphingobacterium olei TaxID=2571155 RepID=A0A4U0P0R0_9SPHI|nr:glycosyltransferase [Sphingobacterium olei]TJZ60749.1 glycosyltransferase [Sphingobacterium olei]